MTDTRDRAACITAARAVYDRALQRIAADYAAGRLTPEQAAAVDRANRRTPAAYRAAA